MTRTAGRRSPPDAHPRVAAWTDEAVRELAARLPRRLAADGALDAVRRELAGALAHPDGSPRSAEVASAATRVWIESIAETVDRLVEERERIAAWAGRAPGDLETLSGLDRSRGDPHRGGRRVTVLAFGSGFRLVYKPRPVTLERVWGDLIDWFGRCGSDPRPSSPRVLEAEDHGWVEHVATPRPHAPDPLVARRAGLLLSLLDVFEVRDAHADNIVAAGDGPVLVDPEALAHPRFASFADAPSLTLTGFLPAPLEGPRGSPGARTRSGIAACLAGPTAAGGAPDAFSEETIAAIAEGYEAGHRILERHAPEPFAAGGPLERLDEVRIRAILRPTADYAAALKEGRSDLSADRSALPGDGLPMPPDAVPRVLAAESIALARGDIPLFHVPAGGLEVLTEAPGEGAAEARIPGIFETSGTERIRRRLARLDEDDRRTNAELIGHVLRLERARRAFDPA